MKEARQFERFGQEPEHLMRLSGAADELADHYRRQDRLKEEIKDSSGRNAGSTTLSD